MLHEPKVREVPVLFQHTSAAWLQEIQLMSEEEDRKLEYIPPFVLAGVVKVYEISKIRGSLQQVCKFFHHWPALPIKIDDLTRYFAQYISLLPFLSEFHHQWSPRKRHVEDLKELFQEINTTGATRSITSKGSIQSGNCECPVQLKVGCDPAVLPKHLTSYLYKCHLDKE